MTPGVVAGCGIGFATGWNIGNIGGIASELAGAYHVALATVGLFTTALFLTHTAVQIPGGKATDRFGSVTAGAAALGLICAGDLICLVAPEPAMAIGGRTITGIGTGIAFIAGNAMVRESGGSALAQGLFGGIGLGAGGVALAVVPQIEAVWGWRAPYASSLVLASGCMPLLLATRVRNAPRRKAAIPAGHRDVPSGVLRDARLYPLALLYSATFGLSVVLGNWVVELLQRHSGFSDGNAAVVGALTLLLGVATRPLGGWMQRAHPERARAALAASLVAGALGTLALAAAEPAWLAVAGGLLVGIGAGVSFAPAFTGAARLRPDAPAASVGLINASANLVVLVGTPLVGLTFSIAGEGRIGFGVIAALWFAALAVLPSRSVLGPPEQGHPGVEPAGSRST